MTKGLKITIIHNIGNRFIYLEVELIIPDTVNQSSVSVDDQIDLIQLFLMLWKRRWLIVASTLLVTVISLGISLLLPKVYEVTAIIEPGKDAEGKPIENPQAIRENILGGAFDLLIAERIKLPDTEELKFKAVVPKNTDLVKISLESANPERGVRIVSSLLDLVADSLRSRLEVKINEAKNLVKEIELKGKAVVDQIDLLDKQLVQTEAKMTELENGRKKALSARSGDAMAVLLYSNELQNLQVYVNNLQLKRATLESDKKKNSLEIENARLKLTAIKGTNINKHPSIPEKPIKPKKTLIVVLAFVLGFMGGIMLALVVELLNKVRQSDAVQF